MATQPLTKSIGIQAAPMSDHLATFLSALEASIEDARFVKLTLSRPHRNETSLEKIFVKLVSLTKGDQLCFVYRHATKDVTKNLPIGEGLALIGGLVGHGFHGANLFTTTADFELRYDKRQQPRLRRSKPTHLRSPSKQHNRRKQRMIDAQATPYLKLLGVANADGSIKKGMEAKFRQINKFIEIVASLLRDSPLHKAQNISVLDTGSGKGYLTFALYDYLTNSLKKDTKVTGVELRQDLVDFCNGVARTVGFDGLHFECGNIQDYETGPADVLMALHACNTATDEALCKAITAGASLVLCAPCCHKELRPQMRCSVPGLATSLKFGILAERQAEIVTDAMRAMLLEAHGYKTSVFEFIATEHTSKNVMIAGVKMPQARKRQSVLNEIAALKSAFGIQSQRLEEMLVSHSGLSQPPLSAPQ